MFRAIFRENTRPCEQQPKLFIMFTPFGRGWTVTLPAAKNRPMQRGRQIPHATKMVLNVRTRRAPGIYVWAVNRVPVRRMAIASDQARYVCQNSLPQPRYFSV
jgi:hypothetical protein